MTLVGHADELGHDMMRQANGGNELLLCFQPAGIDELHQKIEKVALGEAGILDAGRLYRQTTEECIQLGLIDGAKRDQIVAQMTAMLDLAPDRRLHLLRGDEPRRDQQISQSHHLTSPEPTLPSLRRRTHAPCAAERLPSVALDAGGELLTR